MRVKTEETRNYIIEKAFQLFFQHGYNETTTRQIAELCNMNRGLLSYYFPQKEDILFSIYSDFLNEIVEFVLEEYKEEEAITVTCISSLIFFRVIATDAETKRLLYSILENHRLRRLKIEKTLIIYDKIYNSKNFNVDYEKLLLATIVTVGTEAELLLAVKDEEIHLTFMEIARIVIKINLQAIGISEDIIDSHIEKAIQICDSFDVYSFKQRMQENLIWYHIL